MIEITDAGQRYELTVDAVVVGRCFYRDAGPRRVFLHTEIDASYAGRGLATRLIEYALDDCRRTGKRVVSRCPMVSAYLAKHPNFDDLVDSPAGVDARAPIAEDS